MNQFSERLKEARRTAGFTQKALAGFLGQSEYSIQLYEYGKREPDFDTLLRICGFLNISSDWLLGMSDEPTGYISHSSGFSSGEEAAALERPAI